MDNQDKYIPFTILENEIADKIIQDLSLSHLGFYYILKSYSDTDYKPVFPSYELLKKRTKKSKIQIKRIEKDLEKKEFIKIDKKYKRANIYSFVNPFLSDKTANVIKNDNIIKNDNNFKENLSKMITISTNVIKNDKPMLSKMIKIIPDSVSSEASKRERNQIESNHIYKKEPEEVFSLDSNINSGEEKVDKIKTILADLGLIAADGTPTVLTTENPKPVEKKENILTDAQILQSWLTKKVYRYVVEYDKKVPNIIELCSIHSKEKVYTVLSYLDFGKHVMFPKNPFEFNPGLFKNMLDKCLSAFDTHPEFQKWYQTQLANFKNEKEKQRLLDEESREDNNRYQIEKEFDDWRKSLTDDKLSKLAKQGIVGRVMLLEHYIRMQKAGGI